MLANCFRKIPLWTQPNATTNSAIAHKDHAA